MHAPASNVIPLRPFKNALSQAARSGNAQGRAPFIRAVLTELASGRTGYAVAQQLQLARLSAPNTGDCA